MQKIKAGMNFSKRWGIDGRTKFHTLNPNEKLDVKEILTDLENYKTQAFQDGLGANLTQIRN